MASFRSIDQTVEGTFATEFDDQSSSERAYLDDSMGS